jgi:hypothetical protein
MAEVHEHARPLYFVANPSYRGTVNLRRSKIGGEKMPTLPVSTQTDVVTQTSTGAINYLKFVGNTLVASNLQNYGLGSFKVEASGNFGPTGLALVAQNAAGRVNFLYINPNGTLNSTNLIAGSFPVIRGEGNFGAVAGQVGPALISQLANGQLDMLAFNATGTFIASDLVPNTAGLPTVVGGSSAIGALAMFNSTFVQALPFPTSVLVQYPNGQIDQIGLSGSFAAGNLAFAFSNLVPQSIGPVGAVNTNFSLGGPGNGVSRDTLSPVTLSLGVEVATQSSTGSIDVVYFDSGYPGAPTATEGALYASNLLGSFSGLQVVDGGIVAQSIFPIT